MLEPPTCCKVGYKHCFQKDNCMFENIPIPLVYPRKSLCSVSHFILTFAYFINKMLQLPDTENAGQEIQATDSLVFFPQAVVSNVGNDWNINEGEGLCVQRNISQDKEFNLGSLKCNCNPLPTSFSDPSWNMAFPFGSNQYTPSACCILEQQNKKQTEFVPATNLSDIEPLLGKDIENKQVDYGIIPANQGLSNTTTDCRLINYVQPQQPLNLPIYNSQYPIQDSALIAFNNSNTNNYNLCLENDCFDKLYSPSKNQSSTYILDQNFDMNGMQPESIRVDADLSSFIPLDDDDDTILNVNDESDDEDSDIIVEDSDTESEVSVDVGPYIEVGKEVEIKCYVCNLLYSSSEKHSFFQLTNSFPLTFISQTPVIIKILENLPMELHSAVKFDNSYICKRCIDLIDTIESLEAKLVNYKKVLYAFTNRTNYDPKFDWNLLQGNNEIYVEDNIVKLPNEHLSSEQVKETINVTIPATTNTELVDMSEKIIENVSDDCENNNQNKTDETAQKLTTTNLNGFINVQQKSKICNDKSSEEPTSNIQHINDGKQCDRCGKIYKREKELNYHLKKHEGYFIEQCPECCKGFVKKINLEIHLRKHRNNICINCRASFVSDLELAKHSKICCGNKFSCPECKLVFCSEIKLKNHVEKHIVSSNVCPICNKSFKAPSYLAAHVKSHSDDKPFSCQECGKNYKNKNHLNRHMRSHSEKYICSECQKVFSSTLELKNHKSIHKQQQECIICKKLISNSHIEEHYRAHKYPRKINECPICKKWLKSNINKHMNTHAEYKQYRCEICSINFTFKHSLVKHMRSKHNKEI